MVEGKGYNGCHELGHEPRDPGLPWRFAQGVGGGGGAHASPPAPPSTHRLSDLHQLAPIHLGKPLAPIRNSSMARAHSRPSRIAQTTSDWPRRMSPAANSLGAEVR